MPRTASAADQQAIAVAAAAGEVVTARTLERWRAARLIPAPHRRALGRGKGSTSHYTDAELQWIAVAAHHARLADTLQQAVLWMFIDGYTVDEGHLRSILHEVRQGFVIWSESASGSTEPDVRAEWLAEQLVTTRHPTPTTRRLKAAARNARKEIPAGQGKSATQYQKDGIAALLNQVFTDEAHPMAPESYAVALHFARDTIRELEADPDPHDENQAHDFQDWLADSSLPVLEDWIDDLDVEAVRKTIRMLRHIGAFDVLSKDDPPPIETLLLVLLQTNGLQQLGIEWDGESN